MMKYLVINSFKDLQDDKFQYRAGDIYPRSGFEPSKARIKELSTTNNRRGIVLIKEIEPEAKPETEEKVADAEEKPKRSRKKKEDVDGNL